MTDFFNHIFVLLGIIAGLTVFKVATCKPFKDEGEDFSFKELFVGLIGNLLVVLGISIAYYTSSTYGADLAVITMGDTTVTLVSALDVIILGVIALYGSKLINNASEFFGLKEIVKTAEAKEIDAVDYNTADTKDQEVKG